MNKTMKNFEGRGKGNLKTANWQTGIAEYFNDFTEGFIALVDTSCQPLVIWSLPEREHGLVCGTVVVVDNPNSLVLKTDDFP